MAEDVKAEPAEVVDLTDGSPLADDEEAGSMPAAEDPEDRAPTARRVLAGALAVLAVLFAIAAVEALWVKTTLQDEDRFVGTFDSVLEEDAVRTVLSERIASNFVENHDVESFFSDRLPDDLSLLAAPLTGAVDRVITVTANEVLSTEAATEAWTIALRGAHRTVSIVISGNDGVLESSDGSISINLDTLAEVVVARLESRGLELPQLEADLGSITLLESDQLAAAQTSARLVDAVGWWMPVIALALMVAAVFAAFNRRRMVAFLGFGTAIGVLVWLAATRLTKSAILDGIDDDTNREAAEAVWDTATATRTSLMWALLVLGVVVAIGAWLAGSSDDSEDRSRGAAALDRWRKPAEEEPSSFVAFLTEWRRPIQIGIIALGVAFVLFGPTPTGLSVLVTALVVLVLIAVVELLAGSKPEASI